MKIRPATGEMPRWRDRGQEFFYQGAALKYLGPKADLENTAPSPEASAGGARELAETPPPSSRLARSPAQTFGAPSSKLLATRHGYFRAAAPTNPSLRLGFPGRASNAPDQRSS